MPMLTLESVAQSPILSDVTASFEAGRVVGLIGPNGAGKSTLLRTIAGLLPPTGGAVCVDGADIHRLSPRRRAQRVAYLPQSLAEDIPYTIREFVEMGRYSHGRLWAGARRVADVDQVQQALDQMGLQALQDAPLQRVSGGERQRAGIARCLAQESRVMLLDEPISNLDIYYQLDIMTQLTRLASRGHLILIAIHHLEFALRFCDELLVISDGQLYAQGETGQVFTSAMVRDVFGVEATIFLDPVQQHARLSLSSAEEGPLVPLGERLVGGRRE
ncbi:ABC transporter ATP-binding protein [Alicyclobacillus fastidiosus]|uniref:ABC transporter ATP-binding protein n=1 Tax=Alicyclobacillus fastidiosus TaxID=392011 RepID=A0ABY6ZPN7_9BACL|nr:ABC transporter ATP-binding protein [Alicyclobacillus fastidiosus]WAH43895.1 ABC transporter ATP-binding protein [Alicyclobacillus fastidiosus]GMA60139.1 hypothetical protein GCM10025859_05790 [Alicyclobacillus fastidiosus]